LRAPIAESFLQELTPFLTNYHSMKMSIDIDQFSYVEKLARLTWLYLELRLQQVIEKATAGDGAQDSMRNDSATDP
jgi:hypothetical protein